MIVLSPLLFSLLVPLVGWERLVGKSSVSYNANHTHIEGVTNPGAWVMWWIVISMVGYVVVLIGKRMQSAGEKPTRSANRQLVLVLVGMFGLAWWLLQANR